MGGFIGNSILLGVGLAMDAFSVSVVHGLTVPRMRRRLTVGIAGTFAFFQFIMPMIGWICVHTVTQRFASFQKVVPWIALILLALIGINMIREGLRKEEGSQPAASKTNAPIRSRSFWVQLLFFQGIATSIDALSVGFTIANYGIWTAIAASIIIAVVTFLICSGGIRIGRQIGARLNRYASIIGGLILIGIGLEIMIRDVIIH